MREIFYRYRRLLLLHCFLPLVESSWPLDLVTWEDILAWSLEDTVVLLSLELWLFNSTQFSGLGDRSLDMGGGEGVHPRSLRTDSFSSGVFRGGKLSAVSRMSLILAVTDRSSGCNRPSGDGGSSTLPLVSTSCALSSKQVLLVLAWDHLDRDENHALRGGKSIRKWIAVFQSSEHWQI